MSLLSDTDKSFIQSVFSEIHETTKRLFYVYLKSKEHISSSNIEFNPVYNNVENNLFSNNEAPLN
jgi:hypothetical protein